jgi:hypothetical protein
MRFVDDSDLLIHQETADVVDQAYMRYSRERTTESREEFERALRAFAGLLSSK